jgi:hypothetical protein
VQHLSGVFEARVFEKEEEEFYEFLIFSRLKTSTARSMKPAATLLLHDLASLSSSFPVRTEKQTVCSQKGLGLNETHCK